MVNTILLFVPDLFFSTRIRDAAQRLGYNVVEVGADADYDTAIAQSGARLVVLTFERSGDAWERLATTASRSGVNVLAFGSHMNVEAFKRAKKLGCQEVVANSRLTAELPKLLQKWAS